MKTTPVTEDDIARSVWAVPPVSLEPDGTHLNGPENAKLAAHIEAGGVSTLLYGGNANIYAMTHGTYSDLLDAIPDWAGADTWAIPSAGPDFGKLRDQAAMLARTRFPAAMLLPMTGPSSPQGTEAAIRDFADRAGMAAILYLRSDQMLLPDQIGALVDDGTVVAVKYAVETGDFTRDPYLDRMLSVVPRPRVVSGIGEIAAVPHLRSFGLASFTAGAVCIAPRRAMAVLAALKDRAVARATALTGPIQPLEDLRNEHGAIAVIHDAVTLSGVADMGAMTPHLSHVPDHVKDQIAAAVAPLLEQESDLTEPA
ncbi:dihydrodipicolinate synthase family protein [Oceanomicrobium pacificus]|uniref:Dihydrodipicolinate synthase family protein n=1 Tax=Oceanomicrobium pacificus TaxID=2692916 RepID=A0A6B0TU43_9RHOB|nr:dihydrodipicolinate synthase family protein [Oceanomicrobium pacificus]MXU65168.1 dihydrodipicolinate synthase family protein [Oceanomicrobium pacificus]